MSFPTPDKTWQFSVNNTVAVSTDGTTAAGLGFKKIKDLMVGVGTNPWVVVSSSNCGVSRAGNVGVPNDLAHGGGGDVSNSDRWNTGGNVLTAGADPDGGGPLLPPITIDNDVNFNNAGSRHSWIVLRQTGLYTNFEVCLDCSSTSAGSGVIVFSPSVGFSGGTSTNRPSASDEVYLIGGNSGNQILPSTNTQRVFHYTQSTDGQCSRLWVYQAGTNVFFWMFDKAKNPCSGWTNPSFAFAESTVTAPDTTNVVTSANLFGNRRFRSGNPGTNPNGLLIGATQEYFNATSCRSATGIGTAVNTFSSQWPVLPVGIATDSLSTSNGGTSGVGYTGGNVPGGKLGNIYDMWWRPSGLALGDSFPNNAATRQYMSIGEVVVPWIGDGTTLTTT